MLERLFTDKLISPPDLKPSHDGLEVIGVFNPGVVRFGDRIFIAARVVERPTERRDGFYASPRFKDGSYDVDWLPHDNTDAETDPRCYFTKDTGALRLRFISHMRIFESPDGRSVVNPADALAVMPEGDYEQYGIEDPRITVIGGTAYITYVAVSGHGVCTCLMSTTDFKQFHRHSIIFCPDNKDVVLFPEKILGDYVAMHRPMPSMPFSPPKVWVGRSTDLIHWGAHRQLVIAGDGTADHHRDRVGGGTPPIKTDRGWLTIYHGSDKKPGAKGVGRYTAGALLLDLAQPRQGHRPQRRPDHGARAALRDPGLCRQRRLSHRDPRGRRHLPRLQRRCRRTHHGGRVRQAKPAGDAALARSSRRVTSAAPCVP